MPTNDAGTGPGANRSSSADPSFASFASFAFAPSERADDAADLLPEWPAPLEEAALIGPAGDFVRLVGPETEADPAGLLLQFLVAFGNVIGRKAHFVAEADRHYTNLNLVLVGSTSKGRKGTSWGYVKRLFRAIDAAWVDKRIGSGLSSGEGLIWHVRDPIEKKDPIRKRGAVAGYQSVIADHGVSDKRLLNMEGEFALVLRVFSREGNTLSAVIRNAWDHGRLETLVKNNPAVATDAHISIIGHITKAELLRYMNETEAANGFGNRMIWICVRRARSLPRGGTVADEAFEAVVAAVRAAVEAAATAGCLQRDAEAEALWAREYDRLSEGRPGVLGALLGRAEAQVMRLALIYALLDRATMIRARHLRAALEVWRYAEASVRYVFGDSLGDPVADTILTALRATAGGCRRTEFFKLFKNHVPATSLKQALATLLECGLVERRQVKTSGRSAEVWFARTANAKEANEAKEGGAQVPALPARESLPARRSVEAPPLRRVEPQPDAAPPSCDALRRAAPSKRCAEADDAGGHSPGGPAQRRAQEEENRDLVPPTVSDGAAAAFAPDDGPRADTARPPSEEPGPAAVRVAPRLIHDEDDFEFVREEPEEADRLHFDEELADRDGYSGEESGTAATEAAQDESSAALIVSSDPDAPIFSDPLDAPPSSTPLAPAPIPTAVEVSLLTAAPVPTSAPVESGATPEDLFARRNALLLRWTALAKSDDPEIASLFCAGPVHWLRAHQLGEWKAPTSAMLDAMEQYIAQYERKAAAS